MAVSTARSMHPFRYQGDKQDHLGDPFFPSPCLISGGNFFPNCKELGEEEQAREFYKILEFNLTLYA
jgi:hypothetical protein